MLYEVITEQVDQELPIPTEGPCPFPACNPPQPACTLSFWDTGVRPSLAMDPAGNLRVAYDANHHQGGACVITSYSIHYTKLYDVIATAMFGLMAIVGYSTKTDLTKFGSLMFMGLIGIIIASVVNLFMGSSYNFV